MFNESEYQNLWLAYLGATVCGWLVWWKMTAWIGLWYVREPLWLIMAVLLLTPLQVNPAEPGQAPAIIIWLLDTILDTGDNQGRALAAMAMFLSLAMAAYLVYAVIRAGVGYRRRQLEHG